MLITFNKLVLCKLRVFCIVVFVLYCCVCFVLLCLYCTVVFVLYCCVCFVLLCLFFIVVFVLYCCVRFVLLCSFCIVVFVLLCLFVKSWFWFVLMFLLFFFRNKCIVFWMPCLKERYVIFNSYQSILHIKWNELSENMQRGSFKQITVLFPVLMFG